MAGVFGTFLLLLSMSLSGLAWTFFENGGTLDDPTPVYPYPRIILMGPVVLARAHLPTSLPAVFLMTTLALRPVLAANLAPM